MSARYDVSARREGRAVRAFFAWELPEGAKAELATLARGLRARADGDAVRWVRSEGYHVTLRFLGNVEVSLVPQLVDDVRAALEGAKPFEVVAGPAAPFPSARRPRVIVVALEPEAKLAALAQRIEGAVVARGLRAETRRFRAHLTLGRVRGRRLPPLDAPTPATGPLPVREVVLFRSELVRDGSRYTPLARLPLVSSGNAAAPVPLPTSFQ